VAHRRPDVSRDRRLVLVSDPISYVLPIRSRSGDFDTAELTGYLEWLSARADLIVVDGSDLATFRSHHDRWASLGVHTAPADDIRCANGKVRGVLTGIRLADREHIVIADDDVRYDDRSLERMSRLLEDADLVRPQNFFDPLPWHARWDTARILVNRGLGSDYPGTLGIRRSFLRSVGGYDGDVLFENLELIRTVSAAGGRVVDAPALFVRRRPPTLDRFLEQRPRQAYDDWAQPLRLVAFLATGPALIALARYRPSYLAIAAGAAVAAAETGRMRDQGHQVFDPFSPLFAPLWILERATLAWLAVSRRLVGGGCPYAGALIPRAANPSRLLRRRFRARPSG
jgi:hypothetical protein